MIRDFQNALIRLCADRSFRLHFNSAASQALTDYSLSEREENALLQLDSVALDRFATSLLAKRSREFFRIVPVTAKVAPAIEVRYRRWLEQNPARRTDTILDPGQHEALRALPYLRRELANDPREGVYCSELLAFEVLGGCSKSDGKVRSMRSLYKTDLIFEEIRRGIIPIDPDESPTLFRFEQKGFKCIPIQNNDHR